MKESHRDKIVVIGAGNVGRGDCLYFDGKGTGK